jgi:hypothetical protein
MLYLYCNAYPGKEYYSQLVLRHQFHTVENLD